MRGGGAQVTTDLLSEWTDPNTAMEAVGNSLGVFDDVPSAVRALHDDSGLRDTLYDVLLRMVDDGALETRACTDGRYAFRWRADLNGAVSAPAEPPAAAAPALDYGRFWRRVAVQCAPLLLPTLSCVLVLLAFVWLDQSVALVVAGVMAIVGVVGVIRRVQLAAFWTVGLVIAGLRVRFS
jgi:hypothetical protein